MGGWETAAISGAFALIGSVFGSRAELKKLDRERVIEREGDFEFAQTGFRECYRKFLKNAEGHLAESGSVALPELLDNFREARFAGDPIVAEELENYWPYSLRSTDRAPAGPPPLSLEEAMGAHCRRSLEAHLKLKKRKEKEDL